MTIHPSALIDPTVELGSNVEIGPFSVIGPHCKVGEGSTLGPNVVLQAYVTLGKKCQVSPGAVLGGPPQDVKFKGEESYVVVGDGSIIRECVTINRASGAQEATTVGKGCMLMAYSHLGHNCQLGDEVIIANSSQLAGYVEVGDYAFLSGGCVFHQFIKVGRLAMVGGFSASRQDLPPFSLSFGGPAEIKGINKVGMRRRGYDLNTRTLVKQAYKLLFFGGLNTVQAIDAVEREIGLEDPAVQELVEFVRNSQRGIRKVTKVRMASFGLEEDEVEMAEIL